MKKKIVSISLILLVVFCMTAVANAAVMTSQYINTCVAQAARSSGNKVTITFDIRGKDTMDVIGAQTIIVQEKASGSNSWNSVATFSSSDYTNMLVRNAEDHKSSVTYYNAKSDCSYRAKVYFYAEKGGYDTREFITPSV